MDDPLKQKNDSEKSSHMGGAMSFVASHIFLISGDQMFEPEELIPAFTTFTKDNNRNYI